MLCYFFLRSGISEKENAVVRLFKRIYRPSLTWALDNRAMVVFMAVLLLSASVWVLSGLGSEFLPELNEGTMWVNINFPPGISMNETRRLAAKVREILGNSDVVRTVTSKAGRPEDGTDPKPINMAEFFVDLKPPAEWPQGADARKTDRRFFTKTDRFAWGRIVLFSAYTR